MERKLLSLPSFFVLLLVAGIAFLAAPVVDVQAQTVPTATVELVTMTPTGATSGAALTAGGAKNLFIIKFNTPVNVTSSTATELFSKADLKADLTDTSPAAQTGGGEIPAARITLTPIATTAAAPLNGAPAANQWFAVSLTVPASGTGTLVLTVRGSGATPAGAFQSADAGVWATSGGASATVHYDTYDATKPTVAITAVAGGGATTAATGGAISRIGGKDREDVFQLKVTVTENRALAANQALVMSEVSVATTMPAPAAGATERSSVLGVWADPDTTASATTTAYIVVIDPANDVMEVEITVAANAFTDASTNGNDETKKKVTISSRPTVTIVLTDTTLAEPVAETVSNFGITLRLSAVPAGLGGTGTSAAANLQESDITLTNGATLEAGSLSRSLTIAPTATVAATYTAKVNLPAFSARKTPVAITMAAGAFEASGVGNAATVGTTGTGAGLSIRVAVPDPDAAPSTPTVDPMGTTGTALTGGKRGFSFTLPAMPAPTATDGSDRFVVLAKSGAESDNGLTGTVIDIKDAVWQDLADFLSYDGGTINLIGPASPATAKNTLVISEIMWGGDAYLSDPTKSQWIELYNATTTRGTATGAIPSGTWTIEFHAGAGLVSTMPNLSDNFSNRELGNAHWDITNVSGGTYGQSGRTQLTPGTPGSLRDLVSMRRKIDYEKVEKTDHKAAGATNDVANRAEQVKGIPNGALSGSWEASTSRVNMSGSRKGTPGARHTVVIGTTGISKSIVFNEIANRSNKKFDWIELYNPGSADVQINNWVLSKVTAVDKDEKLFKFESDENIVVPAKGFLLVVNADPSETALAAGENVENPNSRANGLPTKVYINSGLDIPKEKYLLILRTEEKLKSHEKIVDIGGHLAGLTLEHAGSATELWPLKAWKKIKEDDLGENDSKTWVRDKGKDLYHGDAWKSDGGVTGLGIDRNPSSSDGPTSGTPGFDNGAVKDKVKDLTASNPVVISEIMFGSGNNRVPQWIELFNPSTTQAVKLNAWRLEVQNTIDASESLNVEYNYTLQLPDVRIQPNQTVLIVSSSTGDSTRDRFPSDRIINIWATRALRDATEMSSPRDAILSSVGFYMKLSDPEKKVVDQVGNIDSNQRTPDDPAWTLPGGNLEEGGPRSSMIRREGTFGNGTEKDAWISAEATDGAQKVGLGVLYYGDEDDIGTPGYRAGGPLPVQLSSFYSKRNDAGAVIITWATESELDNAGFNILRSVSRTGEFTRINAQLIPGAGTTGEKNTYTWTDTSAKPNVLYFYQIEDVSLDGEHRTLRTTRLRGYVGAAGKATTIWGELKSRD